jgi:hypothetical protein
MQEDADDNGVQIVAMECVVWENTMAADGSRAEWTVLVGDSFGKVHLIDITDVRQLWCFDLLHVLLFADDR